MPPPPLPTPIFHITLVSHLASIIQHGGLWSTNQMQQRRITHQSIANGGIQSQRARKLVPCGPQGNLHDYVPFYFGPRSPMLFAIHKGNVPQYQAGQGPIIYLVSSVQDVMAASLPFVFTDGHGTVAFTTFFDHPSHLSQVDWPLMQAQYWNDTATDLDRCRRRQAEFLVHNVFPWGLVREIVTMTSAVQQQVAHILGGQTALPPVIVRRSWYY